MIGLVVAALLSQADAGTLGVSISVVEPERKVVCRTGCGLEAPVQNCTELFEAEIRVITAFKKHVRAGSKPELNDADMCLALAGWKITLHGPDSLCKPGGWWHAFRCISGWTDPSKKTIELASARYLTNSFAHELVHVFDAKFRNRTGHCAWEERGVKAFILEVTGAEDPTEPENDCAAVAK